MNPFTIVYNALWQLAEDDPGLKALIAERNRIHFVRDKKAIKQNISDNDIPELILAPSGGSSNLQNTSTTSKIERRFDWLLSTGDYDAKLIFDVQWSLFRAMLRWNTLSLKWKDKTFAKLIKLIDISEGESDPNRNRGIKGWSCLWAVSVEMHFDTALILQEP